MFINKLFHGGVHPPENKETRDKKIVTVEGVESVRIPMNMHIGAPCRPCVKAGQEVSIGEVIGEASGIAVPIHATVSGTVKSVKKELMGTGSVVDIVEITNDFKNTLHESVKAVSISSKEEFIQAIYNSGLVGLGGAGFPTHMKMKPPQDKYPDILLINGMECEPYITSDDRQMLEEAESVIDGISLVLKHMEIPVAYIGIEDNKKEAAKVLEKEIEKQGLQDKISVKVVPVRYPQGAEKTLIQSLTKRVVPSGGLPHDVKVMVLNVSTVNALDKYIRLGMPLVSKVLTLSGDAIKNPGNYRVPVGTSIEELVRLTGGFNSPPEKILMGGPMMGIALSDINTPVVKNNNAILALKNGHIKEESPCIRCGRCADACPMLLMPLKLDFASRNRDFEKLDEFALMNCIECGSCSYVCPAKRHLVQNIRLGKVFYRNELSRRKEGGEK